MKCVIIGAIKFFTDTLKFPGNLSIPDVVLLNFGNY